MILFYNNKACDAQFLCEFVGEEQGHDRENGSLLCMGLFDGAERATIIDELTHGIPAGAELVFNTAKTHEELVSFLKSKCIEEPEEWVEITGNDVVMFQGTQVVRTGQLIKANADASYHPSRHSLIGFTNHSASCGVFDCEHPMYVIEWDNVSGDTTVN